MHSTRLQRCNLDAANVSIQYLWNAVARTRCVQSGTLSQQQDIMKGDPFLCTPRPYCRFLGHLIEDSEKLKCTSASNSFATSIYNRLSFIGFNNKKFQLLSTLHSFHFYLLAVRSHKGPFHLPPGICLVSGTVITQKKSTLPQIAESSWILQAHAPCVQSQEVFATCHAWESKSCFGQNR